MGRNLKFRSFATGSVIFGPKTSNGTGFLLFFWRGGWGLLFLIQDFIFYFFVFCPKKKKPCLPGNMVVVKILALEQFSEDFSRLAPGNKSTNNVDIDSFDPFSVVFCRVVSVSSEFIEVIFF